MTPTKFKHYFRCKCGKTRHLNTGGRLRCNCGNYWFINSNHVVMDEGTDEDTRRSSNSRFLRLRFPQYAKRFLR